jgi:hypothetical protein
MKKKVVYCAQCGNEITQAEEYWTVGDNFLQVKYFDEQDGSDNIFCSDTCLLNHISASSHSFEDLKETHPNLEEIDEYEVEDEAEGEGK